MHVDTINKHKIFPRSVEGRQYLREVGVDWGLYHTVLKPLKSKLV
jgi:hypothetical protein